MRQHVRNGDKDATHELGSLINLARAQGYYARMTPGGVFEIKDKRTENCVYRGTAAEVYRWLRDGRVGSRRGSGFE